MSEWPTKFERIERTLKILTPDPRNFGETYGGDDVRADLELLKIEKNKPEYVDTGERSDSKILEKTFTDAVESDDWFSEDDSYGEDPDYLALTTFPTSEVDDVFGHIDAIAFIKNVDTDHELVPFAIDLTYNTDFEKIEKKFSWIHTYGKKANVPSGVSEFGRAVIEEDNHGNKVTRTRRLALKDKYGLKIPGFASAKYFEDKNNPLDPQYPKGRIPVMPRFVVGYSPDIANTIANGMPDKKFREKYGDDTYKRASSEYMRAALQAKWCTLLECAGQANDLYYMLDNLKPEETKHMDKNELEVAKKMAASMAAYFTRALDAAYERAKSDEKEKAAMRSAMNDKICQTITLRSNFTYTSNRGQESKSA
jgi:hypothetical protein